MFTYNNGDPRDLCYKLIIECQEIIMVALVFLPTVYNPNLILVNITVTIANITKLITVVKYHNYHYKYQR